jgi:defect-in-organelle-trafficking protein DotC
MLKIKHYVLAVNLIFFVSFSIFGMVSLSGCSLVKSSPIDTSNPNDLAALSAGSNLPHLHMTVEVNPLRSKSLQDTALSVGAQSGLAYTSEQINMHLEKDRKHLEAIFNFNAMMLSHGVLPPVLVQANNHLEVADAESIRIADKTYQIIKQARFATAAPNWRDYLWMNFSKPEVPNKVLLPRNRAEKAIWTKAIHIGWEKGTQQAHAIFRENVASLKRDFSGMLLYRELLQKKMISAPYVTRTDLGVTGNSDAMRIHDQVLRITVLPQLKTDSNDWKPVVIQHP